jgi:hypothetical protein
MCYERHERQLADLDADIEHQKSNRNVALRQPDAGESAGESEPMHESEGEGDEPRCSSSRTLSPEGTKALSADLHGERV